jgi:hypothetical protein
MEEAMKPEYEKRREREDDDRRNRTGVESYEQKLDRWKEGWRRELDHDLERGY